MANPPNRETSLPMAPGSLAQVGTGKNQGKKGTNVDSWLTMMDEDAKETPRGSDESSEGEAKYE